ncbi:MAG: amino acid adenylation domain-containing protein [Actinophytocola sp.]|uniref:amino acid adenylation domain-containing protein n=1 Tax=Actinophytocola sp. TaxID=1872138 RepID=UPI003C7548D1
MSTPSAGGYASPVRLVEDQADRTPSAVAVECGGRVLTYVQLNAAADRLACRLRRRGVGPERLVALMLPRSVDLVVALLAIGKTGAAYLPVDPRHPAERNLLVLGEARPVLLIGEEDSVPGPYRAAVPTLMVGADDTDVAYSADEPPPCRPDDLAYVLYTSGSTGRPKGVAVTVANLGSMLSAFTGLLDLGGHDRLLAVTTIGFDIAGLEIFAPLLCGARVVLATDDEQRDPRGLAAILGRGEITVMQATPTLWQAIVESGPVRLAGVRVLVGGEALPERLAASLVAAAREVTNVYGPTETTVWSTASTLRPGVPAASIGGPIEGTRVHVLDGELRPAEFGELYIAGPGVARGYLGRPGTTAGRFVADPFGPPGSRMYRTGDLVRRATDGDLEFVGRSDDQVKIRGYRVELGEVEAVASARLPVSRAVAAVREDSTGVPRLAVYVVPVAGADIDPVAFRRVLSGHLPEYMVPSTVVVLTELPRTPNGKVDRAALPAPGVARVANGGAPRDDREAALCRIFTEVLGVRAGPADHFFDLGGHSLLAFRVIGRIRAELGAEPTVRDLFAAPTARSLASRLDRLPAGRTPPGRQYRPDRVPLSYAQRRLWFLDRIGLPDGTYNVPLTLHMRGPLDVGALRAALGDVVARHECLRTVFPEAADGEPWQRVLDAEAAVPRLSVMDGEDVPAFLRQGFDLAGGPVLRAGLVRTGQAAHLLLLVVHHIACDGWSMGPLVADLCHAYAARSVAEVPGFAPLPLQYADVALWQRTQLGDPDEPGSRHARLLGFWRTALAGLPEQLALPYDRSRPTRASYRGDSVTFSIGAEPHEALARTARREGATVFMAFHALLAALLTKIGAGTDIPIGTPVAGRDDEALADLVGFFVNTVVLRADTSGDPDFRELLRRVRGTDLDAFEHGELPFESLVEALNPPRSLARHPLFQVLMVAQDTGPAARAAAGLEVVAEEPGIGVAKFDLTFHLAERPPVHGTRSGVDVTVEYSTDLFDESTVRRLAAYFQRLLHAVLATPDAPVSGLDVLAPDERRRVLIEWNDTAHEVAASTLPGLIEAQAARTPDVPAVVHEQESVTYADLNARANRMARLLAARGAGPEETVALVAPRSVDMVVALLGVVKTGAAYLPVDLGHPDERIELMLRDCAPILVLTTTDLAARIPPTAGRLVVDSAEVAESLAGLDGADLTDAERTTPLLPEHPLYVIYTSGSTGRPKGVVLPASAMVNLLAWHAEVMPGGTGVTTAQFASLGFDAAAQEIFSALTSGKTLAVPRDEIRKDVDRLVSWLDRYRVNELFAPTPVVEAVGEAARRLGVELPHLRHIAQAGEALTLHRSIREFCAAGTARRLHNYYGPTETHVVTGCTVPAAAIERGETPPIGPPIWNTKTYVLDSALRPVPVGVPGELYLAGVQVARGYLNRPGLTAQRFVADPHGPAGTRMYRTGDLARWLPDGSIEFLGRTDFQVKVRGFRVELGEIETVLAGHPDVARAIVLARERGPGDKRLVGYVVPRAGVRPDPVDVRRAVARSLPEYMVPSAVVVLDTFPLTQNGKVDRAALPEPDYANGVRGTAPRGEREAALCRLFAATLGIAEVGVDDDFFELGGHSLLATRLISRIRGELRCELSIIDLFDRPTVQGVAERMTDVLPRRPALHRRTSVRVPDAGVTRVDGGL